MTPTSPVTLSREERWQMVPKDGGYVIEEVDSGRTVTTTPLPETEALRVTASYNIAAGWAASRAVTETPEGLDRWLRHDDTCPARRLTPDLTDFEGPCDCGLDAARGYSSPLPAKALAARARLTAHKEEHGG